MPSVSAKQKKLMAAVAHNPKFAKKVGIPQKVGREFNRADMGLDSVQKYTDGGKVEIDSTQTPAPGTGTIRKNGTGETVFLDTRNPPAPATGELRIERNIHGVEIRQHKTANSRRN